MKKTILAFMVLLSSTVRADLVVDSYNLYSLQPLKDQPEIVELFAFCPSRWDRYGVAEYKHCKTYNIRANLAELKNYLNETDKEGLKEEQILEALSGAKKQDKKTEDSLAVMFGGALLGPAVPFAAFFKGMYNSFKADELRDYALNYSHPLVLLMASSNTPKKVIYNMEKGSEAQLMKALDAYLKKTEYTEFTQKVIEQKNKEIEKAKKLKEIREAQQNYSGG